LYKDKIYVTFGEHGKEDFGDVSVFDLNSNEWSIPKIHGTPPKPRSRHCALIWNDSMVVFGGCCDEEGHLNDCFLLDFTKMEWRELNFQNFPKLEAHSAVIFRNKIIVYGGFYKALLNTL